MTLAEAEIQKGKIMDSNEIQTMIDGIPAEAQIREEDTKLETLFPGTKAEAEKAEKPEKPYETKEETVKDQPKEKPVEKSKVELPKVDLERQFSSEEPKRTVPVPVVADLRQRLRLRDEQLAEANKRIAELSKPKINSLDGIQDDDMITGSQLRQIERERIELERQRLDFEKQKTEQVRREEFSNFVKAAEADARSKHADFDTVVSGAYASGVLTSEDTKAAMDTDHPAEFLYNRVQSKMNFYRSWMNPPSNESTESPKNPEPSAEKVNENDPESIFRMATGLSPG